MDSRVAAHTQLSSCECRLVSRVLSIMVVHWKTTNTSDWKCQSQKGTSEANEDILAAVAIPNSDRVGEEFSDIRLQI